MNEVVQFDEEHFERLKVAQQDRRVNVEPAFLKRLNSADLREVAVCRGLCLYHHGVRIKDEDLRDRILYQQQYGRSLPFWRSTPRRPLLQFFLQAVIYPFLILAGMFVIQTTAEYFSGKLECRAWYNFFYVSIPCHILKQLSQLCDNGLQDWFVLTRNIWGASFVVSRILALRPENYN